MWNPIQSFTVYALIQEFALILCPDICHLRRILHYGSCQVFYLSVKGEGWTRMKDGLSLCLCWCAAAAVWYNPHSLNPPKDVTVKSGMFPYPFFSIWRELAGFIRFFDLFWRFCFTRSISILVFIKTIKLQIKKFSRPCGFLHSSYLLLPGLLCYSSFPVGSHFPPKSHWITWIWQERGLYTPETPSSLFLTNYAAAVSRVKICHWVGCESNQ